MDTSRTLAAVLESGVELTASEAVAIVQRLMQDDVNAVDARAPFGPLSPDNVAIDADGTVRCLATAASPSVYEAAAFLELLLSAAHSPVPGALRYTVGRAMLEVEAPPFDSCEQFSAALARFEPEWPGEAIACLHARAMGRERRPADRRRLTTTHAALRRDLREADLRLYAATTGHRRRAGASSARVGAIGTCFLAGATLMIAGGAVSSERPKQQAALSEATPPGTAVARDIALPVERVAPVRPARVRTSPRAIARTRRPTASPVSTTRRKAPARAQRAAPERQPDADRGVIARIRFEWDNPFR